MNKRTFIKRSLVFLILTFGALFSFQNFIDYKMRQIKSGNVGKINKVLQNKVNEEITVWGASTAEETLFQKS